MEVGDPFGNKLRFSEPNKPGPRPEADVPFRLG